MNNISEKGFFVIYQKTHSIVLGFCSELSKSLFPGFELPPILVIIILIHNFGEQPERFSPDPGKSPDLIFSPVLA